MLWSLQRERQYIDRIVRASYLFSFSQYCVCVRVFVLLIDVCAVCAPATGKSVLKRKGPEAPGVGLAGKAHCL